jgi:polysaccharide deacetylase 2 family uncharacterized protein YibQ
LTFLGNFVFSGVKRVITIRYLKKSYKVIANRRKDEKRLLVAFLGVLLMLSAVLVYFFPRSAPSKSLIIYEGRTFFNTTLRQALVEKGFKEIKVAATDSQKPALIFEIPPQQSEEQALIILRQLIHRKACSLHSVHRLSQTPGFTAVIDYGGLAIGSVTLLKGGGLADYQFWPKEIRPQPQLAVVIDDFGFSNNEVVRGFIYLNAKLTMSVIPGHNYSRWTAAEGKKNGKEILIHMPMEPERNESSITGEPYMIRENMQAAEIEQKIAGACQELPEASGMNNHMGSLVTADPDIMKMVISGLKRKGLYFIDSLTSPRSVAYEVARSQGVRAGVRSVFLDNIRDKGEIETQFEKALEVARRRGKAIAIGHVNQETLEVLQRLIKSGKFAGVNLCFASEIVS